MSRRIRIARMYVHAYVIGRDTSDKRNTRCRSDIEYERMQHETHPTPGRDFSSSSRFVCSIPRPLLPIRIRQNERRFMILRDLCKI